jgi:hypothetical protein
VRIVNTPKGGTGFVSHFADLEGIEGIHRGRPLEIVPYTVARSDFFTRADRTNPFVDTFDHDVEAGVDVKYGLTSTLTLTGTINPDFGQVEVDPAVVNLSQFETFYEERRPFFTEGVNLFDFADTPAPSHFNFFNAPSLFYSRRIGRSPQGSIDADHVMAPTETTILGAAKLTGKIGRWSVGVLDALTAAEHGRFVDGSDSGRLQVEPMTNYFVSRMTREIGTRSRIGFMLNSVQRDNPAELSYLRDSALTLGVDGYTSLDGKNWILEWAGAGTRVTGSREAIALTQTSPSRQYQRPDAGHVEFDPTRTSLSGWLGSAMISKATGDWRPIFQVQANSPGLETNDAGFMQRTDIISIHGVMQYVNQRPSNRFREKNVWFGAWNNRNFDGDTIERGLFVDHRATLANYWNYRAALFVTPGAFDDRLTRGGPIVRSEDSWQGEASVGSDDRKRFFFEVETELQGNGNGSWYRALGVELTARPRPNLTVSVEPTFSRAHEENQYLAAFDDAAAASTYGRRYLFSEIERREFELGTRVDWTLNARLSFQLYAQPFVAAGDYHDHHALVAARTADFVPWAGTVAEPDFNFRSVRGSAVVRWEFRPGSALYVVWNENRAGVDPTGEFRLGRNLRSISTAPSQDVFLVKLSWWLPM